MSEVVLVAIVTVEMVVEEVIEIVVAHMAMVLLTTKILSIHYWTNKKGG